MPLSPEFDEFEAIDWTFAFTNSGFTRHQQALAAARLERGLAQAAQASERVVELEAELARLRTMIAALVDYLAERGAIDMPAVAARIADAVAKASATPPAGPPRDAYR